MKRCWGWFGKGEQRNKTKKHTQKKEVMCKKQTSFQVGEVGLRVEGESGHTQLSHTLPLHQLPLQLLAIKPLLGLEREYAAVGADGVLSELNGGGGFVEADASRQSPAEDRTSLEQLPSEPAGEDSPHPALDHETHPLQSEIAQELEDSLLRGTVQHHRSANLDVREVLLRQPEDFLDLGSDVTAFQCDPSLVLESEALVPPHELDVGQAEWVALLADLDGLEDSCVPAMIP